MSERSEVHSWKEYNRPWYAKFGLAVWNYIKNVGLMLWGVIKAIPRKVWGFIQGIGKCFQGLWLRFVHGDWRTKISYLIMGFGNFSRGPKQFLPGFLWLALEAVFVLFMFFIGAPNLSMFGSLGENVEHMDENYNLVAGDNSMSILLFGVLSIVVIVFFAYMWVKYTKIAYKLQEDVKRGKALSGPKQQINYALNDGYHVTVLILPILGVLLITVLPLLCNILVAFTNYDDAHKPPAFLFTWTGWAAFKAVFGGSYGQYIWRVLGWTLIWAVFATFTNFFFGMFLAMMINKKSIKIKAFWRVCFIIVIAVPDFVTLLMMSQFFGASETAGQSGPFNVMLMEWFGLGEKGNIDWFSKIPAHNTRTLLPRVMVIVVNMWRGMPFTMLATSGILMNIPEDLYESSRIDGAGPVRRFVSITFPYIMFVMGPQLITTFTGNINNFNVIWFLTGGGPTSNPQVGSTDLLITWLFKLTVNNGEKQYNLGAVIGIFTFIISSFFSLIVFNSSKSVKQEDTFQ